MSTPFSFPDWMPWWAQLLVVITAILLALAFALMPFSVFGVKARLEALEERLDEIQGEIRALSLRLPEPGVLDRPLPERDVPEIGLPQQDFADRGRAPSYGPPPQPVSVSRAAAAAANAARPPIPPAAWSPGSGPRRPIGAPPIRAEPVRAEPEIYRPGAGTGRVEPRVDRGR